MALAVFFVLHAVPVRPAVKSQIVGRFGARTFSIAYSIVSVLALAWLIGRGDDIVTIPGTKRAERFDENVAALGVTLSTAEVEEISALVPVGAAAGERYPEAQMKRVFV